MPSEYSKVTDTIPPIRTNDELHDVKQLKLSSKSQFYLWPLELLTWLKMRWPAQIFSFLMLLETINFISDCLQLNVVIQSYQKYAAPPFSNFGVYKMSVVWNIVSQSSTSLNPSSLLGYTLSWNGSPNPTVDFLNCISGQAGYPIVGPTMETSARSNYNAESTVCVSIYDVFNNFPTSTYDTFICPNNETGVFDNKSVYIRTNEIGLNNYKIISSTSVDMTLNYVPNWTSYVLPFSQCQTLSAIYIATVVIFTFECCLLVCQAISSVIVYHHLKEGSERIRHIVEFPLVGWMDYCLYFIIRFRMERVYKN